jgi:hypothetical protein
MKKQAKRKPVIARCYVLRADRNGRTWWIGHGLCRYIGVTDRRDAVEFRTLANARAAKALVFWPEWRIWRRGKR